ncbi:sulfite oxidase [Actinacidiphila paucisporea]|uniref:DMSO/TMAO reductase YedYZ, molybdopterin-dependent catalytic subunit n=1 Tax=Actinacidiphila paucisporea TaxID=310782 RepID=A0A1M7QB36_9ACTN|nr:sulfite oxidase [Actinacidiphila paucisporea]SHN27705.1 DMSO/TMAO reductase YedYZ, molybdopterin-dependent catalytic subunit [Actinacidiphila paucisporea]
MRSDESTYDRHRLGQWLAGEARAEGVSRRDLLRLAAAAGVVTAVASLPETAAADTPAPGPGIVKPLPPEWFTIRGTNAETNWAALRGTGFHTPVDRFFVRNHSSTPVLDQDTWSLKLWGSGLRGAPGVDRPVEFDYHDLRRMPSVSIDAFVECAGNGRSYFTTQQGDTVTGTAWTLGAIGTARWRGVPLSHVLERAGLTRHAVDVQPRGLDEEYVSAGANLGHVRRPLPVAKALDDVILAYEMNGEPLPYDHGHPVRVLVPSWVGVSNIKWVGDIEVSAQPLYSPWNTDFYKLFGPAYPEGGSAPLSRQTLKSAFESAPGATYTAGTRYQLTGRSWSGSGGIRLVEVSTDDGATWRPARLHDRPREAAWSRWSTDWRPTTPGPTALLARATDTTGRTQPVRTTPNTQGYLFDAVVRNPVTVLS